MPRVQAKEKAGVVGSKQVEIRVQGKEKGPPAIQFRVDGSPIATNAAYRRRGKGPGMYLTTEAKFWKQCVEYHAQKAMLREDPYEGDVGVSIDLLLPNPRQDVDGPIKLILDAMEGIVYHNDSQVRSISVRKFPSVPAKPGAEILVYRIDHEAW